ncbi:MAG: YicC/YloC family endoribonuclease [Hyphomicrobiales bacterium]
MTLSSMTGFARGQGAAGAYVWNWEIKSVNAKGLDVRFRLPPGWDAIEVPVRKAATDALGRGTVYGNLTVERKGVQPTVRINEPVLNAVIATLDMLDNKIVGANRPTLDGILALKGVMEIVEEDESEGDRRAAEAAIIAGFNQTLAELVAMRRAEGATLGRLLSVRIDEIGALAKRAEAAPGRKAEAVKARLAEQVATLLSASQRFDSDRLHQEAILLATKADIREELDRLASHGEQVRKMLADGGAVGRKLDFLAQELNRESNTLTAKANDVELTNIGLELKSVVEQFREQVQNLE